MSSPELEGRFFTTVLPGKPREKSYNSSKGAGRERAAQEDGCGFEDLVGPSSKEEMSKKTECIFTPGGRLSLDCSYNMEGK